MSDSGVTVFTDAIECTHGAGCISGAHVLKATSCYSCEQPIITRLAVCDYHGEVGETCVCGCSVFQCRRCMAKENLKMQYAVARGYRGGMLHGNRNTPYQKAPLNWA